MQINLQLTIAKFRSISASDQACFYNTALYHNSSVLIQAR